MEKEIFNGFELNSFWKKSDYALQEYVEAFPVDEMIASIEQELGYKLPASYIKLMGIQNGGFSKNICYPTADITGEEGDYIDIGGFLGIGRTKSHSLLGDMEAGSGSMSGDIPMMVYTSAIAPPADTK